MNHIKDKTFEFVTVDSFGFYKISVIIDADDADRAVSAVHAKFIPND